MRVLPQPDHDSAPYFEAAARHELKLQRCSRCKTILHLPRPMCFNCQSLDTEWFDAGRTAKVVSWTNVTHQVHPLFPPPYVIALVELDEPAGIRMITNIRECEAERLRPGLPLELMFEDLEEGTSLPMFRPAAGVPA
jgi:uncharacterized OB-fold protein